MEWLGAAYITLLVLTEVLGVIMLVYTLRRRTVPGAAPLAVMIGLMMFWSAVTLAELGAMSSLVKLSFFNLRQIAVVSLPVAWLMLAVEVYEQMRWRRWKLLGILFVLPVITLLLAFTHQPIIREGVGVAMAYGLRVIATERGPWVTISTVYTYAVYIFGIVLVLDVARRSLPVHRNQTLGLLAGILALMIGALSDLLGVNPIRPLGSISVMFVPAALCFMWALFRFRLFDVLPVAHDRVLELISDGVMVVNGAGQIVEINRAARMIFARTLPSQPVVLGKPLVEALAEWPAWQAAAPESRPRFEVAYGTDKDRLFFEVEVTTLTNTHGDMMGQIMLINDITAQKLAYELVAERERILVLQRFIRDASHDLRTPMSVIQSSSYLMKRLADKQIEVLASLHPKLPQVYAAIIEEAIDFSGKLRDRAVASDESSRRLWSILSGMIELAELEGAHNLEIERVDFNLIVELILKGRRLDSERHGVEVTCTLDIEIPPLSADEKRLGRAVDAVILNALQYTPEGGKVRVLTESVDGFASILVSDNGIGISPDDLPRVYERFFRADQARSTETGGAGLGLSLAKTIIEAHGGQISVDSILGVGSTVKMLIPTKDSEKK